MTPVGVPELNKNFYSLLKLLSQKEIFCDFFSESWKCRQYNVYHNVIIQYEYQNIGITLMSTFIL